MALARGEAGRRSHPIQKMRRHSRASVRSSIEMPLTSFRRTWRTQRATTQPSTMSHAADEGHMKRGSLAWHAPSP